MNVLGVSAFYHDSAACLLQDGEVVAAAQEERFSRRKHDASLPTRAVAYCLESAGLSPEELDYVAFHEKPLLKLDRLLHTYLSFAPLGFRSFKESLPLWIRTKVNARRQLDDGLGGRYRGRYVFPRHHESHAASAFFPSPFENAAVLTMDGVGEWATASMGVGDGHELEITSEMRFPHSLGLLYSAFTTFAGFRINSGEYKLMGLSPYGEPRFVDAILEHLVDLKEDGSFRLNLAYLDYCHGLEMTNRRMERLLEGPPRRPEAAITQREMDIAASIQAVTEEVVLRCTRHLARQTGRKNLVLAGGVALNCVANGKILRDGRFENVWVQPAAGDAGAALGAAFFVWHQLLGRPRRAREGDCLQGSLLGPSFQSTQIATYLQGIGAIYDRFDDEARLLDAIVDLLAREKVVALFQGRMEFGPRALGARSIIADARSPQIRAVLNERTKFRESFRPFAPAVLRERAHLWFDLAPAGDAAYMSFAVPVSPERCLPLRDEDAAKRGLDRLSVVRSQIPAVTHVDGSARVQTVDERHGLFHRILRRFEARTGCPVLLNTSLNVRGEPIACTPADAFRCFMRSGIEALVLEDLLLYKERQPAHLVEPPGPIDLD